MHTLGTLVPMTSWGEYVVGIARTEVSTEIASATGIGQSTIYRWLHKGAEPTTAHAAKFALTYGRNVLEAFVAAGFLTEEEAGMRPAREPDLAAVAAEDLAAEVTRRLTQAEVGEDDLAARRAQRASDPGARVSKRAVAKRRTDRGESEDDQ